MGISAREYERYGAKGPTNPAPKVTKEEAIARYAYHWRGSGAETWQYYKTKATRKIIEKRIRESWYHG